MNPLYDQALNLSENLPGTAANISRVAKATSPEAAQWAFTQWSLRKKARAKFTLADQMLFDRDGLEMSTHEGLAEYHASLFPAGVRVLDLTVGIGADLIAMGRRGEALGCEIDSERAQLAIHNLTVHGVKAEVWEGDFREAMDLEPESSCFYADPSRRESGRRTIDPAQFSPNPLELKDRFDRCPIGVLKLSPMLPDDFLESLGGRLEFLSYGGECREALIVLGTESEPGRLAVLVENRVKIEAEDHYISTSIVPLSYLYEADPAAVRAHCLSTLANEFQLEHLADSNGYLVGERSVDSPWMVRYRVIDSGRGDLKEIRRSLTQLNSGTPILKQKGAGLDLQKLHKSLKSSGDQEVHVTFYRDGAALRHAILARET